MEKLTINGVTYVPENAQAPATIGETRIIVADRGWVFVGKCEDQDNGDVIIRDCKVIRRWGTTNGLGELINGPTKDTVADETGTVRTRAIVTIAVKSGW